LCKIHDKTHIEDKYRCLFTFPFKFKRKEDDDWVKKCMEYEVYGPRPRGRPKKTWREVVKKDCQACKLNKEDATDHSRWRKLIMDA